MKGEDKEIKDREKSSRSSNNGNSSSQEKGVA